LARFQFCTFWVDEVPRGAYCFYQNYRNGNRNFFFLKKKLHSIDFFFLAEKCPPNFTSGYRRQDQEDDWNNSGVIQGDPLDIFALSTLYGAYMGNYPTISFCCPDPAVSVTEDQSSLDFIKMKDSFPAEFTLLPKNTVCPNIAGRTVASGSIQSFFFFCLAIIYCLLFIVYYFYFNIFNIFKFPINSMDDEDDGNKNLVGGNFPRGDYGQDTTYYYCSYSTSACTLIF